MNHVYTYYMDASKNDYIYLTSQLLQSIILDIQQFEMNSWSF